MIWLIEPFAGTFALTRALLGGVDHLERPKWPAPVGYMGAKNALAAPILRLAGLSPGQGAHRVTLGDGSTIGKILPTILRSGVPAMLLRTWEEVDPQELWFNLRDLGPPDDPLFFAPSWLWLQARAASGVPVWWAEGDKLLKPRPDGSTGQAYERGSGAPGDGGRYTGKNNRLVSFNGDGNGPYAAWQKCPKKLVSMDGHGRGPYPAWQATGKGKERANQVSGIKSPSTIADRLDALRAGFDTWKQQGGTLDLWHGGASSLILALLPAIIQARAEGWRVVVYLDPPYQGATGYERSCSRAEVLDLGRVLDGVGAEVLISEAVGLPLEGWHHQELPSKKPEWLTCNRPVRPSALRGALFSEAA